ncbi:MAG: hypothetical protein HC831_28215 [Chloroflexia bacterium]|nr:hypothetical protein [Chloroflexia bacterium]
MNYPNLIVDEINSIIDSFQEKFNQEMKIKYPEKKDDDKSNENSVLWRIIYFSGDIIERIGKKIKWVLKKDIEMKLVKSLLKKIVKRVVMI